MANPLQIVTLGDSITQATSGRNSYRRDLWNKLTNMGYSVDFVGSENQTQDGRNFPDSGFDPDHEGHWGWRTDEIINGRSGQGKLADWLQGYTPDIALVHLGSNDAFQRNSVASTIDELRQTFAILRQDNPNVAIFVAQLIPVNNSRNQDINALNAQLPALVNQENTSNSPVILVDQNSGFDANSDTYDGVHPNESGEAKMAQRWFEALESYLDGAPQPAPPSLSANDDQITTAQDKAVNIDILANDAVAAGTSFTLSIEDGNLSGSATINRNGTPNDTSDDFITYQPSQGFTGSERFTYRIDDGQGDRSSAEVIVTVNPVAAPGDRVQEGLLSLYTFNEGSGSVVRDVSGVGTPLDLTISSVSNVSWGDGTLALNGPSLVSSGQAASKLNQGIAQTQEITIEAWISPANRSQQGPARIATLSGSSFDRNFTLGQQGDDYNVRLRTTQTGNNGFVKTVSSSGGQLSTDLTHVVYSREADGDAFLFINNQLVSSTTIDGNLSNWNSNYQFALGDELTGGRAWLGSYDQLAIYNQAFDTDEVAQNFLAGLDDTDTAPMPPSEPTPDMDNTAPELLSGMQITKAVYAASETLELVRFNSDFEHPGWVIDMDGLNDVTLVDFKVTNLDTGVVTDVADVTNAELTRYGRWGNFDYQLELDGFDSGAYELTAVAYDQFGAQSETWADTFRVNSAPELRLRLGADIYAEDGILGLAASVNPTFAYSGWVIDMDGLNDVTLVDFKVTNLDTGVVTDVADVTNAELTRYGRWGNFDYQLELDGFDSGAYELTAVAYDQSGAQSETWADMFRVNSAPELRLRLGADIYAEDGILGLVASVNPAFAHSGWVIDMDGLNDVTLVDFKVTNLDTGVVTDVADVTNAELTRYGRWGNFDYQLQLDRFGAGNYELTAIAYDQLGAQSPIWREAFAIVSGE